MQAVGNTDGLGGAFGLMWALGVPLPAPEGRPWSPSLQLRLFNSGNALAQVRLEWGGAAPLSCWEPEWTGRASNGTFVRLRTPPPPAPSN